jgi:peptide/nickel transport system substrate-binding protein
MLPLLEKTPEIKLLGLGGIDQFQGNFRLNHASPPFDNPAIRRVLWKLCDQNAILTAIGVPEQFRTPQCSSFWMCDTPYSTTAGADGARIDIDAARAELKAAGYDGTPVIAMEVSGSISQTASRVLIQNMRAAGFVVDQQPRDWPTVLSKRAKKDGWSMFAVYSNGTDMFSPLSHFYVASTCEDYPGWSCDARVPPLLVKFAKADTTEDRKRIAAEIQTVAYELTPSVMWGQFTIPAGYRKNLKGLIQSSYPMFWEVDV